jgi:nucleoside transporter
MDSHPPLIRTRLSALMFLEFFTWGTWGVAITGYAAHLGYSESQIGWLGAVPAIGAIVSPLFVGLIADRFFAAQRMLCVLHLMGGACLIAAGFQQSFLPLMILMLLNGMAFMPTIALANAVAFRHIPNPDRFPRIAVLGTIGWIAAILAASVLLGGEVRPNFLFLGGIGGIVLALYALTLPDTPPKGAEAGADVFGLSALKLLKEPTFLIFTTCVFLFSIPACGYFFTLMVPMLRQRGYPAPLALTSLNQFAEIIFMFSMPWFVLKLGLKRVVLIGMGAWAIRYLCFARPEFHWALLGLILHGFCYSFFYVGAYMYVDRRAPAALKASAQSLVAFLLVGVGYLVGAKGAGFMMGEFPAAVPFAWQGSLVDIRPQTEIRPGDTKRIIVKVTGKSWQPEQTVVDFDGGDLKVQEVKMPLPPWNAPESAWRYLDLSGTVKQFLSGEKSEPEPDLADKLDRNHDGKITLAEVEAIDDAGLKFGGNTYSRSEMIDLFHRVAALQEDKAPQGEISLDRQQWLRAQSCNWGPIWLWPSAAAFVILGVFAIAFRDKPQQQESQAEGPEKQEESTAS